MPLAPEADIGEIRSPEPDDHGREDYRQIARNSDHGGGDHQRDASGPIDQMPDGDADAVAIGITPSHARVRSRRSGRFRVNACQHHQDTLPDGDAVFCEGRRKVPRIAPNQRRHAWLHPPSIAPVVGALDDDRADAQVVLERYHSPRALTLVERRSHLWNRTVPVEQVVERQRRKGRMSARAHPWRRIATDWSATVVRGNITASRARGRSRSSTQPAG